MNETLKLFGYWRSSAAYRVRIGLNIKGLSYEQVPVHLARDGGEQHAPEYAVTNPQKLVPVLVHGERKIRQSGVILDYLAELTRKFGPKSDDERREVWRWILFDNHKFTANLATLRYLIQFARTGETPVTEFLRARCVNALKIADAHLAANQYVVGKRPTIADFSMCGYLFYGDELTVPLETHIHVLKWMDRISSLPGWKHPYELMPRAYSPPA